MMIIKWWKNLSGLDILMLKIDLGLLIFLAILVIVGHVFHFGAHCHCCPPCG